MVFEFIEWLTAQLVCALDIHTRLVGNYQPLWLSFPPTDPVYETTTPEFEWLYADELEPTQAMEMEVFEAMIMDVRSVTGQPNKGLVEQITAPPTVQEVVRSFEDWIVEFDKTMLLEETGGVFTEGYGE